MKRETEDIIRNFGMANLMAEVALDKVEEKFNIDLGRPKIRKDSLILDLVDIEEDVRKMASEMASHYELFFCLEVSIRKLISQRLGEVENYGPGWWDAKKNDGKDVVPQAIRDSARKSRENEISQAITARSEALIDYTTFGELGDIIVVNWDIFGDMFTKKEAVQRVMRLLNTLRGPIAHCCILDDHEISRLHLTVRDWFKLMS